MSDLEFLIRHTLKLAEKYPGEPEKVVNDVLHSDAGERLAASHAREVERPASAEVMRAAEHIAGQDAGWKDYNATNRASVTCARAILAGQGAPAAQVVDYEAMNAARVAAQIEGRRLPCPREGCGAKAGEPCGGGSGEWWHAERGAPRHRRHPRQGDLR